MNQSHDEDEKRLLILSGKDVDEILDGISINDLIANQTDVFSTYSSQNENRWESPIRTTINSSAHTHLFMPSRNEDQVTIKCVAVPKPGGNATGLPATGLVFHPTKGQTKVIINVAQLTGVRTAAGCLSASIAMQTTKTPDKTKDGNIVIFGTGMQAKWHARLFVGYYRLGKVTFITTSAQKVKEAKASLQQQLPKETQVDVLLQDSPEMITVLNEAHFICGCTPSTEPRFAWDKVRLRDDVHFSLIGSYKSHMQEVPAKAVERAASENALSVDSIEACSHEAGDLLKSSTSPKDWQEIGKIVLNKNSQDVSDKFSMFKSVGFALQDTAIFNLVVKHAEAKGIGKKVDFY
ncbi:NAD(P)-binding protein [Meira miltonrushii]|uniref:NAD(P)-binding protein n=1 Tax=Meira miltonrushii TaxID=1280837 RepID=A0A316VFN7_9BASI|nr:NAD(P)-binding protein [Meira miltonrushii]PWN36336.1 NAD(P)-binding protein [Meira miltonrushii]